MTERQIARHATALALATPRECTSTVLTPIGEIVPRVVDQILERYVSRHRESA